MVSVWNGWTRLWGPSPDTLLHLHGVNLTGFRAPELSSFGEIDVHSRSLFLSTCECPLGVLFQSLQSSGEKLVPSQPWSISPRQLLTRWLMGAWESVCLFWSCLTAPVFIVYEQLGEGKEEISKTCKVLCWVHSVRTSPIFPSCPLRSPLPPPPLHDMGAFPISLMRKL